MNLDQRQFILTWDTTTETHTIDSLREKHGKTNLFDDDGVWTNDFGMPDSRGGFDQYSLLEHVLAVIVHGEQWVCDNCTVVLAGPACKTCGVENTRTGQCGDCSQLGRSVPLCVECVTRIEVQTAGNGPDFAWRYAELGEKCSRAPSATHDEQEMSQGYHGPSFKGGE